MAILKDYKVEDVEVKNNIIKVVKENNEYAWIDIDEIVLESLSDNVLKNFHDNVINNYKNGIMEIDKLCLKSALQSGLKLTNVSDIYLIGYLTGMVRMAKYVISGGGNVVN